MIDHPALPAGTAPAVTKSEQAHGGRLLLGWILIAAAVVMLFVGWLGVSANPQVAVQLSYFFSGGFGGLVAGIVGVGLLISDDVRADRARLGRLEATVADLHELLAAQTDALERIEARLPAKGRRTTTKEGEAR